MSKIMGRPKGKETKDVRLTLRINRNDFEEILGISMDTGENYSDIIRKAIRYYTRIVHKKDE